MNSAMHEEASMSVLRRMKDSGFDFAAYHCIEFYAIFPEEKPAKVVAKQFCGESLNAQIQVRPDGVWHLQVSKVMYATHEGIGAFEADLEALVVPLGGTLDGWGVTQEVRPAIAR